MQTGKDLPIPFEEIVTSTLATLRVHESLATGTPQSVDTAAFLGAFERTSNPNLKE